MRPLKSGETLDIVVVAIDAITTKSSARPMRLDEVAPSAVHIAERTPSSAGRLRTRAPRDLEAQRRSTCPPASMHAYFGNTISTACPRISSSRLGPKTTSPSPPALATGAHSEGNHHYIRLTPPPGAVHRGSIGHYLLQRGSPHEIQITGYPGTRSQVGGRNTVRACADIDFQNVTVVRRMLNPYFSEDPTGERAGAESDVVAQQVLSGELYDAIGARGCSGSRLPAPGRDRQPGESRVLRLGTVRGLDRVDSPNHYEGRQVARTPGGRR